MNGQRIKYFRELNNYKREWLAEKLGINVTQVSRIENNQSQLNVKRLYQIAQLFNVSVFDLFEAEHIKVIDAKNFEKYGPVESNFIRYLLRQSEVQEAKYNELVKMNGQLMKDLSALNDNFKRLMDYVSEEKNNSKKLKVVKK